MKPRKIKKKPTKKIPGGPTRPAGFAAGAALRKKLKAKAGAKPTAGRQLKATKKPVKKMRGGGMVKKMRGGGMVKKMRKGGAVRKKK